MKKAGAVVIPLIAAVLVNASGCSEKHQSAPDCKLSEIVASVSSEQVREISAEEAVRILIDGNQTEEVFLLHYYWYGKEYESSDSLNKTMMDRYGPKESHAPAAANRSLLSIEFDRSEEPPSSVRLTQYANTVRADSGIPFDTIEPELEIQEGNTYNTSIDFRRYKMYYYLLECEWNNGNLLKAAFAVERK